MSSVRVASGVVLLVCLCATGCSSTPEPQPLQPPETFDWAGQPMTVSPPPVGWRREGETSGGIRGVRFVKERSVGEAIGFGDFYQLADRDRRAEIRKLADVIERADPRTFRRVLSQARPRTDSPFSSLETEVARAANTALDDASAAYFTGDVTRARGHVEAAFAAADRLHFSLDDVLGAVVFTPGRREEPGRWTTPVTRAVTIDGEPAVVADYLFYGPERQLTGREVYVVFRDHLFVGTFLGLETSAEVFDRVVASIRFPR